VLESLCVTSSSECSCPAGVRCRPERNANSCASGRVIFAPCMRVLFDELECFVRNFRQNTVALKRIGDHTFVRGRIDRIEARRRGFLSGVC